MGFALLIPFFLIRFGLLSLLNKEATMRAAHFPQMENKEKLAYWIYQLSNAVIFLYIIFLQIKFSPFYIFISGAILYVTGSVLLIISIISFANPAINGINLNELYRFSRNPMYISYFILFLGCVLLTQSLILLVAVIIFQLTAHQIILSEEKWCIKNFKAEYISYMKKNRRYL